MKRREFISLLGGATSALYSIAARAQQPAKMARLGYLAPARLPNLIEALQAGLRDFGYVEGQNLAIEYRFALGQTKSYDELAQELVRLDPAAIVLTGTPAALALKRQTTIIPHHFGAHCRPASHGPCEEPRSSWGQRDRCHDVWP